MQSYHRVRCRWGQRPKASLCVSPANGVGGHEEVGDCGRFPCTAEILRLTIASARHQLIPTLHPFADVERHTVDGLQGNIPIAR